MIELTAKKVLSSQTCERAGLKQESLISSVPKGQIFHRDTCRMLGVSKTETFNSLRREDFMG